MCISLKVCKKKQLTFAIVVIIQHLFVFSAHFNTCLCLSLLFVCEFCLKDTLEHTISVRTLFKLMPLMNCKATKEALGGFFVIILPFTLLIQINLMVSGLSDAYIYLKQIYAIWHMFIMMFKLVCS